jgi:hypothetical protein
MYSYEHGRFAFREDAFFKQAKRNKSEENHDENAAKTKRARLPLYLHVLPTAPSPTTTILMRVPLSFSAFS